jgi:hypothetical protein
MQVRFSSTLQEAKEIQSWNIFNNAVVDRIGSASLSLPTSMTLRRAWGPGQGCGTGAHTVILCRYFAWPRGRTALYTFDPQDFWDFWGGCTVTFGWFSDTQGSGLGGDQTPPPTYPSVRFPDRTLMRDATGTGFIVVFGGAGFAANPAYLGSAGFNMGAAIPFSALPSLPADGTLVSETSQDFFIVFGGAKFYIRDLAALFNFGYDRSQVRIIPPGGTAQLRSVPIDGTLIREQNDGRIFFVDSGQLRHVMNPSVMDTRCFPGRHVRIVPDNTLAALPHGPDLS